MKSTNIIPFEKARVTAFSIPLDKLDGYEGVSLLARLIRQYERDKSNKKTYRALAQRAGLTPTTVSNIASRTTKAPRLHTCLMIFKALGFSAVRFE